MEFYADIIYETNKEIIEFTPYQAVHCTLAGIKIRDLVTEHYFVTKTYLHALAVKARDETDLADVYKLLNINSYEILLYESDEEAATANAELLNKTLLDNGLATLKEKDAHFLQLNIENYIKKVHVEEAEEVDVAEELAESEDENYYDKMLEITSLIESLKMPAQPKQVKDIVEIKTPITEKKIEDNNNIHITKLAQNSNVICVLKPLHKHPRVVWYQDDYFIYIIIHAPDVKDYYLKINENTVYYCAERNDEREMCILNLLDTIQTDHLWYNLVGLNLKIRLLKTQFVMWPRLLQQRDKFPWLKYDLDKVKTTENVSLMRSFYLVSGYVPEDLKHDSNDDESGSESADFDEMNAQHYIDDADPFAEDF